MASQAPPKASDCPMIIVKRSVLLLAQNAEQKICANTETHIRMSLHTLSSPATVLFRVTQLALESSAD